MVLCGASGPGRVGPAQGSPGRSVCPPVLLNLEPFRKTQMTCFLSHLFFSLLFVFGSITNIRTVTFSRRFFNNKKKEVQIGLPAWRRGWGTPTRPDPIRNGNLGLGATLGEGAGVKNARSVLLVVFFF